MSAARHDHVLHTWKAYGSAAPQRLLEEYWPRVLPLVEGRPVEDKGAATNRAWFAALEAFDELVSYGDSATLLRRSVELLRDAIGLERAAVFLLHDGETLRGTFGTGVDGQTTDERHIAFTVGDSHRAAFVLASQGLGQWSRFRGVPLFAQQGSRTVVVRQGENVIVPIPSQRGCIGLVACDWGLTGSATDPDALLRTAVFTRVLSPLLGRCMTSATWVGAPGSGGATADLVGAAIRRLRTNPDEDRETLAKALGTTADRLGRAFKAEIGETLLEYRNRLRLERFFSVVDPRGGNLLPAALEAGFGSYAQFHRVFHDVFRCAPIDYLKHAHGAVGPASALLGKSRETGRRDRDE